MPPTSRDVGKFFFGCPLNNLEGKVPEVDSPVGSVDRRRTYRGGERCAPSGRSANRDAGVGRMRIEKRNTIILEAAAVVTTAAVVVRTEQTV